MPLFSIQNEKTAKDRHEHVANMPYDANRPAKELEGRFQANRLLIELTNSLFGSHKKIDVNLYVAPANFQGPTIKFDFLNLYHWAGIAIMSNVAISNNSFISDFITKVEGTYAQIMVGSGPLIGSYLMSIRSVG